MIYDPFQQKAIDFINEGCSVIVAAPTGAGKTAIAEYLIEECLKRDEKIIYTAPIKALSNQKFREFEERFPGKVGLLTGDVSLNASASTLIMTTEIFRNKILEEKSALAAYSWIIFDEIHYMDDEERGSVWEESLMFLPDHMNVLGLSATVPNVEDIAEWFHSIHRRPLKIVREEKRPVPLSVFYQCQNQIYEKFERLVGEGFKSPDLPDQRGEKIPKFAHVKANRLPSLMSHLQENDLLPCIYFVFSRRQTEFLAQEARQFDFLNAQERREIVDLFERLCQRFDVAGEPSAFELKPFIEKGIAYHHAGMLPTLKEVVERLFTSRLIKVIFTTETFALGINMPARTVVFNELRKYHGRYFGPLKTRDFYQMAGRAGRRSLDKEGFVFCRIDPHYITPSELHKVVYGQSEEVRSRFNAGYATLLNLYHKYNEKLYDVYPFSFHYFQERKFGRKKAVEILRAKVKLLKDLGYIRKNQLTHKGLFASTVYGYELLLSELYDDGTLEELSESALGILSAALVYEPRKGQRKPDLPPPVRQLQKMTERVIEGIHRREKSARIAPLSKRCYFHLAPAIEEWMRGKSFDRILQCTDVDEGEIIRYFRMSVQLLRELADAPVSEELKKKVYSLIDRIKRDVVDSEKMLRS